MTLGRRRDGFHLVDPAYERAMTERLHQHVAEVNAEEAAREEIEPRAYGLSGASVHAFTHPDTPGDIAA